MKINQLYSKENKWTQHVIARDKDGKSVPSLDIKYSSNGQVLDYGKNAVAFSLYGAICRCYDYDSHEYVADKLRRAIQAVTGKNFAIAEFNNLEQTTFADVKKVVEKAEV